MAVAEGWLSRNWKLILVGVIATGLSAGIFYAFNPSYPVQPIQKKKKSKKKRSKLNDGVKSSSAISSPASSIAGDDNTIVENSSELALEAKKIGNSLFAQKKFVEAIEQYDKAIALSSSAVYYCNRAACHSNLGNHDLAIKDCTRAIELDKKYIKAFHRRALAYEQLGEPRAALNEYTVVCALEGFQNQGSMAAPDRLLKSISTERGEKILEAKIPGIPSETFITAYMDSFRVKPTDADILFELVSISESDQLLKKVFEAAGSREWRDSFDYSTQAIDLDDFSNDLIKAKAYNYRGTMRFLMGLVEDSVKDLDTSLQLDPLNVNTLIKRATLYMERGEVEKTIEQFTKAENINDQHPDLFYHRGQVRFLTGDFQGAVSDYTSSIKFEKTDESSVYVHIQMGVANYKLGDFVGAEMKFKEAKNLFPLSAEVWNYHGEILLDKQSYEEAEKSFDKAIEMDPKSPLPYINKAILNVQWKEDTGVAETQCRKAIGVDPLCDIAYTQLAQLLCLQNKLSEAVDVYEDAIKIARTEAEIINVVSCQEAALAQMHVLLTYPEVMAALRQE